MKSQLFRFLGSVLLVSACLTATAADSPFLGSPSEPHATLHLNVDQTARQIYPVEIWAVDGKLTNRSDQGMLWIKPGSYVFNVRVARTVNLADLPGLQRGASFGQEEHQLKLTTEAGKAYYIGAKFTASGKWQPVVWKTATGE
jgi:hypothetical protein